MRTLGVRRRSNHTAEASSQQLLQPSGPLEWTGELRRGTQVQSMVAQQWRARQLKREDVGYTGSGGRLRRTVPGNFRHDICCHGRIRCWGIQVHRVISRHSPAATYQQRLHLDTTTSPDSQKSYQGLQKREGAPQSRLNHYHWLESQLCRSNPRQSKHKDLAIRPEPSYLCPGGSYGRSKQATRRSHTWPSTLNISWLIGGYRTDWVALGATRTHACSCTSPTTIDSLCPFHAMVSQLEFAKTKGSFLFPTGRGEQPSKQGWVATFEWVATHLGEPLETPTGASRFTGHSGRATGAVHLAQTQIELWRIQLFGRWGSDAFKLYVRQAPLSQLHLLAQEASVHTALANAKAELAAIFAQIKSSHDLLASRPIAEQPLQCLLDCEAAAESTPIQAPPNKEMFVLNRRHLGKIHKVATQSPHIQHYLWHTSCHWYFARHQADYKLVSELPENATKCAKCFGSRHRSKSSSSASSTSESSCATASG